MKMAQIVRTSGLDKADLRRLPKGNPEEFAKFIRDVPRGTVAVRTPDTMKLGETADVEALLAPDPGALRETVALGMRNPRVALERVRIGDAIAGTIDAPGFDVTGVPRQEQSSSRPGALVWFWTVRATAPGQQRITVAFYVTAELDGTVETRRVRSIVRDIAVREPFLATLTR
ncbi:MAG: hypothetical protein EXQ85_03415 [Alphaproteobacteria bacterium]|nr:hypothetical protein [Alphaproteobacteria bacterium]